MALHHRVATALADAGSRTERPLTKSLRRSALDAGWSASAASSLQVHHDGGAYRVSFSDEAADWEYGTTDRPPLAVIRTFHNHLDDHASPMLERHLLTELRGLL